MVTAESIEHSIKASLPCVWIRVEGDDGHHFSALIVSELFQGKNVVKQHQLVYQALGDRMREEIHALSLKTYTPEQWEAVRQSVD
ncbi:BolA family transcriptional regulator [Nitrosomonas sp. HPC101]|uniref:BolA/IbaG family iron-sulfur metabolism protein n=1 Tax=Nitrosomonas sp. HPC101 TaxID=1658667 RepID=UPI001368287B|nr:BolA family transcriptional regulator [Nitrosomonas sp. HPC101]